MSIRTFCAAAVVALGVGQAEAATVYDVIFTITKAKHLYIDDCYDEDGSYTTCVSTELLPDWRGMSVGDPLRGVFAVGDDGFATLDVGGLRLFGDWGAYQAYDGDAYWWEGSGGVWYTYLSWNGTAGTLFHSLDNRPDSYDTYASLTLAPVPLPATAALLPLGIGALAMMRRRRRVVS